MDGIYHVVRAFEDTEITHVDDTVDPVRDLETIQFELCQKDLAYVDAQAAMAVHIPVPLAYVCAGGRAGCPRPSRMAHPPQATAAAAHLTRT